jgi:multiple antibiotic resistance protein
MEINLGTLITMYMIMLGPIKLILPFAFTTSQADPKLKRAIALKATIWGLVVAIICLLAGDYVVHKFLLSEGTLLIAISIFLGAFAYSLANVGDPSRSASASAPPSPSKDLAIFPIAFPGIIPAQGFGLLVLSTQVSYSDAPLDGLFLLLGLAVIMMILNYIFMIGASAILKVTGRYFWLLLSRFLSPLFVAMAIHLLLKGLKETGIV